MINYPDNHVDYEIINRLLDRLDYIRIRPETILIVGLHVEYAVKKIQQRCPSAIIKTAQDTASICPAENNAYDLIIAHFALLREREPLYLLHEFHRVLRDEGLLLFTSLGPDTFFELRHSFSAIDNYPHVHTFLDMHHMGDWMRRLHFSDPVVDREEMTVAYDDLNLFFDDLKSMNATNVHEARCCGLMTKNKWFKMMAEYEKFKTDDYFPVTLEVIYGHGWKVKLPEHNEFQDEVAIPINTIKRKND